MMRLHHVAQQHIRRLSHRYGFLRHFSITTTCLTLLWVYTVYWGERSVFQRSIEACKWERWEEWPRDAAPHHLALIADPQLVDPHTYPGRPWPLSTATERYTDLYMSRNFRLINARLDPDSIMFLGDLFDGGREWPVEKARDLKSSQRKQLEDLGVLPPRVLQNKKRSLESYEAAMSRPHADEVTKEEHNIGKNGEDLKAFIPGESGRWTKWGARQWQKDLHRFAQIFYEPDQMYPNSKRFVFPAYDVNSDPVSLDNGATDSTWQEYASTDGKSRQVISGLPGNHDLGLGAGVQLVLRDRFESHFGPTNRIDVLGNHTIVSVDAPSLSAHSQYLSNGWESEEEQYNELEHLWKPSWDFIDNIRTPSSKAVSEALRRYYPQDHTPKGWKHEVLDIKDVGKLPSTTELVKEALRKKPQLPIILLSHVPLFRNMDMDCGPLREKDHYIKVQMGYQYQNVLTQTLSKDLVARVSLAGDIVAMFSGDDHDYCDITHRYNIPIPGTRAPPPNDATFKTRFAHIREITVKSFSWAMGVRRPGFLLVSLWNPVDAQGETVGTPLPTVQTHLCLLPDQLSIFMDYGLLFLFTLAVLLVDAVHRVLRSNDNTNFDDMPLTLSQPRFPRFQMNVNGLANGFTASSEGKAGRKKHQHCNSTSSFTTHSRHNSDGHHLGVGQRSYNARTRSVSPAANGAGSGGQQTEMPLIEKAGYYPAVRWTNPEDEDSDEESNVGGDARSADDSQAKWKWRRRTPGRARKVLDEFAVSLLLVGLPGGLWYFLLIKNG